MTCSKDMCASDVQITISQDHGVKANGVRNAYRFLKNTAGKGAHLSFFVPEDIFPTFGKQAIKKGTLDKQIYRLKQRVVKVPLLSQRLL